ncbi:nitric oxide synthase, brain-like [Dreissena polymorpha]|uniref:nitric oxide synthase, brain-like n=1 Tax=Dreissena polymorpha TaxID=45954 RepID=UPI002263B00B|nr:nitric oxide synthase, brain-like [Dreissena polymorpha]
MSEQNGRISVAENGTVSQLKYDGKLTNGNVVSEDSGIGSRRSSDDYIKNGLDLDSQVKKASTSGKESIAPAVRKFVKLRHVGQERPVCSDTLHTKCIERVMLTEILHGVDHGPDIAGPEPRPREEMLVLARDFINQFYQSIKRLNTPAHTSRLQEVDDSVKTTGTYELTTAELTYGAKTAWRNSARCIGRIQWSKLQDIAKRIGFDTRKSSSLWKDRTLVEINVAVLHSYQSQGVTITDHHAASESFMKHLDNKQKLRGGCPADWVWVVPPMSGSLMSVFHQEMLNYKLKPSFEYQADAWKNHVWKKDKERTKSNTERPRRKIGFRELARAVKFSAKLMGKALARRVKCVILYATETGKSEGFAKTLCQLFKHAFDAKVYSMQEYDVTELEHEALVLIVTSTFGNGDPPENGESFAKYLLETRHPETKDKLSRQVSYLRSISASDEPASETSDDQQSMTSSDSSKSVEDNLTLETGPLSNVRFSLFGLGSSAYPNFCAFAHYVDTMFASLGAERIHALAEGDELCGQEESFRTWAKDVFKAACETFCTGDERMLKDATGSLSMTESHWTPDRFRVTPASGTKAPGIIEALSTIHGKNVLPCRFIERKQLQSIESDRQTMLIKLDATMGSGELLYHPGDHVAIFAENSASLVDAILMRLHNAPSPDQLIKIEVMNERSTAMVLGPLRQVTRMYFAHGTHALPGHHHAP